MALYLVVPEHPAIIRALARLIEEFPGEAFEFAAPPFHTTNHAVILQRLEHQARKSEPVIRVVA